MSESIHFDALLERRNTDSIKWNLYPPDVLPLWVADMDFRSPDCVINRLSDRIQHGIFGYGTPSEKLIGLIIGRLWEKYHWRITSEMIVFIPGVVTGLNLFCQAFRANSEKVVVQTPVYPPIFQAPANAGLSVVYSHLVQTSSGRYEMDLDDLESKFADGIKTFILCNPHNPVGRVFTKAELQRVADLCNQYGVTVCSDEIHGDLVFDGHTHIPLATLNPDIEQRTITYLAPSKTFNIAGLECAYAVIPNKELRTQYISARKGIVPYVNILGYTAAEAAYEGGQEWLVALLDYLASNRDFLQKFITANIPEIKVYPAEGTYLAWLDCRELGMDNPYKFFLDTCKVGLNAGIDFCEGGEGFVRLNFGCPLATLKEALERIHRGLRL
jgi:cystathionine beta-lyase